MVKADCIVRSFKSDSRETMWPGFTTVLLALAHIHFGSCQTAYFLRKSELGYYSVTLDVLQKISNIQCVSACALLNGCSVSSFSRNQSLCKLSTGTGMYIDDPGWISMLSTLKNIYTTTTTTATTSDIVTDQTVGASTLTSTVVSVTTTSEEMTSQILTTTDWPISTEIPTTQSTNVMGDPGKTCPAEYTMTSSGRCYCILTSLHTFMDSRKWCMHKGGTLAAIESKTENHEVTTLLQGRVDLSTDVFLAATDDNVDGAWQWLDGKPLDWMTGGPLNPDPDARCLAYAFANGWEWRNKLCSEISHSVCKTEPV